MTIEVGSNVQLKSSSGNDLFPRTKASLVILDNGQNLGTVEPGAQVNILEGITINGVAVTPESKIAKVTLPDYTVAKLSTPQTGYAASYQLQKDGVAVGPNINIPKDMVVQSGSVKTVTTADTPVSGYKVGEKYIDLVLANADNQHIYILVSDLVDVYTAGTGITITGNTVAVDTAAIATVSAMNTALAGKADKATTLAGYGIADAYTKTEVDTKVSGALGNTVTYVEI
jgi:hypothetical protein